MSEFHGPLSQPAEGLHIQKTDQSIGSGAEVVLGVSLQLLALELCKTFHNKLRNSHDLGTWQHWWDSKRQYMLIQLPAYRTPSHLKKPSYTSAGLCIWGWALRAITKSSFQRCICTQGWLLLGRGAWCLLGRWIKRSKCPSDPLRFSSATTKTYLDRREGHSQTSWYRRLTEGARNSVGDARERASGRAAGDLNNLSCSWTMTAK